MFYHLEFQCILKNNYTNLTLYESTANAKNSAHVKEKEKNIKNSYLDTLYCKFLRSLDMMKSYDETEKDKTFKTKILRPNEFITCDICAEKIKLDELSLYSSGLNMCGHFQHIIDFINDNYKPRYLGK